MDARPLIEALLAKGAKFTIYTNIMYGRGINGVGFNSYTMYEEVGEHNNPKTKIYRTFQPMDNYLLIIENYKPPKIPWNRAAEKEPYSKRKYIGYDKITYISETI